MNHTTSLAKVSSGNLLTSAKIKELGDGFPKEISPHTDVLQSNAVFQIWPYSFYTSN